MTVNVKVLYCFSANYQLTNVRRKAVKMTDL